MNILRTKKTLMTFVITLILLISFAYIRTLYLFPQNLMIVEGKEYLYNFKTPFGVGITADKNTGIEVNGSDIKYNGDKISINSPFKIQSNKTGKINLKVNLFGSIPLKTVIVNVIPETKIIPCGNTVGVKIFTKGILVVGTSSVMGLDGKENNIAKDSDIQEGDIILKVQGKITNSIEELLQTIEKSNGNILQMDTERDGKLKSINIRPIKALDDGKYKIGLWVRDSTTGIGTLTFYDPKSKSFGALGHGITDIDTGSLLRVNDGSILESSIISVKKGKKGDPGELKGIFLNEEFKKGRIFENNECGIYGQIDDLEILKNNAALPVALRSEIKEGPAVILSNIDGKKVDSFTIEIQKVLAQNYQNSKSMVIKITDPRLLSSTGGIVQGMSGSPIIQNDKFVGAVTHVFVNDPTRGYGIFAELMIQNSNNIR